MRDRIDVLLLADAYAKYFWCGLVLGTTAVGFMMRQRFRGGVCKSLAMLKGKTVIVTGANTGIGKETALDLVKREARVILACRDLKKGERAANFIRSKARRQVNVKGNVSVKKLDLSSFASVNSFCDDILKSEDRVDVLINNAGVFQTPFTLSDDGYELQFAVNHLGHFLLTNRLLPLLKQSKPCRVVIVSSSLHKRGKIDLENLNNAILYSKAGAYSRSKLANVLFAKELHERYSQDGINVYCLHPGIVRTELGRYVQISRLVRFLAWPLMMLLFKSPTQGAQTSIYCAVAGELEGRSGHYYGDCVEEPFPEVEGTSPEIQKALWEASEEMTGLKQKSGLM